MSRIPAWGIFLPAITLTIFSCAKPKDLEFVDLQNVRVLKWGLTTMELGVDLRLYNPNNQRVQLKEPQTRIYANSAYLGTAGMDSVMSVPKRDTFAIPLRVNIETLSSVSQLLKTLSDTAVTIRVEGTVKMGKAGVFKSFPVTYQDNFTHSELKHITDFGF